MRSRDHYERNLELYEPVILDLPVDLIDIVKRYLIWDWAPGTQRSFKPSHQRRVSQKTGKQDLPDRTRQDSVEHDECWDGTSIEALCRERRQLDYKRGQGSRSNFGRRGHVHDQVRPEVSARFLDWRPWDQPRRGLRRLTGLPGITDLTDLSDCFLNVP
jgi:hypothetical protein